MLSVHGRVNDAALGVKVHRLPPRACWILPLAFYGGTARLLSASGSYGRASARRGFPEADNRTRGMLIAGAIVALARDRASESNESLAIPRANYNAADVAADDAARAVLIPSAQRAPRYKTDDKARPGSARFKGS